MVGREQSKAALEAVTEERHERRCSILAVAAAAAEHARHIGDALDHDGVGHAAMYNVYDKSIVDGMVNARSGAPAHEVGSADGVIALLALRDQFVFLGMQMAKYLADSRTDPEFRREIDSCGDNPEYQSTVLKGQQRVLAGNVRSHPDEIQRRYVELAATVSRLRSR